MSLFDFGDKVAKARKAADKKNVRVLLRLLRDESYAVQIAAVKGLAKVADPSCVNTLLPLLKDPELEMRAAAAEALGNIGDAAVRTQLLDCLQSEKNEYVRQCLRTAAANIR